MNCQPAPAMAGFARSRASSRSSAPVPPARRAAASSTIRAGSAAVRAGSPASARSRSTSRPASRTARASGSPARARPAARGGAAGDLYIFLSIKPHRFFQRDGANIYCRVPISMTQAALGGEVEVPAIDGGDAKVACPRARRRATSSACAARDSRSCARAARRYVHPGRGGDAAEPDPPPARAAGRVRRRNPPTPPTPKAPASFPRVKEFFEGLGGQ